MYMLLKTEPICLINQFWKKELRIKIRNIYLWAVNGLELLFVLYAFQSQTKREIETAE